MAGSAITMSRDNRGYSAGVTGVNVGVTAARPLTAVRLGPLTCFCACAPEKAAASTLADDNTEFFAEEVFDAPHTSTPPNSRAALPAPFEGSVVRVQAGECKDSVDVRLTSPNRTPVQQAASTIVASEPTRLASLERPSSLTDGRPQTAGVNAASMKQTMKESSDQASVPCRLGEQSAPSSPGLPPTSSVDQGSRASEPNGSSGANAEKQQRSIVGFVGPHGSKAVGCSDGSAAKQRREGPLVSATSVLDAPQSQSPEKGRGVQICRWCVVICLAAVVVLTVVGGVELHSWNSQKVPQALDKMRTRTCTISDTSTVSRIASGNRSFPIFSLDWIAVTCWVSLQDTLGGRFQRSDGLVPLTIYKPQNLFRLDLPPLSCTREVSRLASSADGAFTCAYAEGNFEKFGVMAVSKEDLLQSGWRLSLWRYSQTGLHFTIFITSLGVLILFLVAGIFWAMATVCCWHKWCSCKCWTYGFTSMSALLTVIGLGWIGYQCHRKAQAFADVKTGTCHLLSQSFRIDAQEHPTYALGVAGHEVSFPGEFRLRGRSFAEPVLNLDWTMATCWVHLAAPAGFGAMHRDSDGMTPLTYVDFRLGSSRLQCQQVVQKLVQTARSGFECMYAPHAFDGLGVLASESGGPKVVHPFSNPLSSFAVEVLVSSRAGFPFLVWTIATCVTVLSGVVRLTRACCACKARKKTSAREPSRIAKLKPVAMSEPLLG